MHHRLESFADIMQSDLWWCNWPQHVGSLDEEETNAVEADEKKWTLWAKQWANQSIEWCKSDPNVEWAKLGTNSVSSDCCHEQLRSPLELRLKAENYALLAKIQHAELLWWENFSQVHREARRHFHTAPMWARRRGFSLVLPLNVSRSVHTIKRRSETFHDQFVFGVSRVSSDFTFGASKPV